MPPKPKAAQLFTSLHKAIKDSDAAKVSLLLEQGAKAHLHMVPDGCKVYMLPLEKAIELGDEKVARVLLENGADATLDIYHIPLLHRAFRSNNRVEMLRVLLEHGAEVNDAETSLLHTVLKPSKCKAGVLEVLLEYGADVNLVHHGRTPLVVAASYPHNPQAVKMLLERGALASDNAALYNAMWNVTIATRNHRQLQVMRLLLEHGADVNVGAGTSKGTALHRATYSSSWKHEQRDDVGVCRTLLDAGADIDAVDSGGRTALHRAVQYCTPRVVALLLDRGADTNVTDRTGKTPLMLCAVHDRAEAMDLLIRRDAALNAVDGQGMTALHRAVLHRTSHMAVRLLHGGADINVANRLGKTALMLCAMHGRVDSMELLIKSGAALNATDTYGNTALHLAGRAKTAAEAREQMCRLLARAGVDPFVRNFMGLSAKAACIVREHETKRALEAAADKVCLATLLAGMRVGAPGAQPNSLTRLEQHDLFDPNVLGVVADVLMDCGSRHVTRRAASSSSSAAAASSSSSSSSRPTKRARV